MNNLFKCISINESSRKKLSCDAGCDSNYIDRWVDASISFNILYEDLSGILHIKDRYIELSKEKESADTARMLQGVFSILVSDAIIDDFKTGIRQGYSLIDKFNNISPYYGDITESIYGITFDQEVFPTIMDNFESDRKLTMLDYGCGNGWLLRRMNVFRPNDRFIGAGFSEEAPDSLRNIE
ncbi:hypothetical protein HGB13_04825, partial [bacterium]|nr:hypothetical protein [bacterium]